MYSPDPIRVRGHIRESRRLDSPRIFKISKTILSEATHAASVRADLKPDRAPAPHQGRTMCRYDTHVRWLMVRPGENRPTTVVFRSSTFQVDECCEKS